MQNDKILPCPFCNRRAELRHDKDGFSYIVCANDGCYVRTDGHLNEESAIKHWNTRKPMERIVEQLEERHKFYENRFAEMSGTERDVEDWGSIKSYADAIEIVKGGVDNAG